MSRICFEVSLGFFCQSLTFFCGCYWLKEPVTQHFPYEFLTRQWNIQYGFWFAWRVAWRSPLSSIIVFIFSLLISTPSELGVYNGKQN